MCPSLVEIRLVTRLRGVKNEKKNISIGLYDIAMPCGLINAFV